MAVVNSIINIKNIPEIAEINLGDLILIETKEGTRVIDYENFVITENNTTFQPVLSSHAVSITDALTQTSTISANLQPLLTRWNSSGSNKFYTLSSVGIGVTLPEAKLHIGGALPSIIIDQATVEPVGALSTGDKCAIYLKSNKLILKYNDGGTTVYKYLNLNGTDTNWYSTSAASP